MDYLRGRELVSAAYREVIRAIVFDDGGQADAVCYVINRDHPQYCGPLSLAEKAVMIGRAAGTAGPNTDYLFNTHDSLAALGIIDEELEELVRLVRAQQSSAVR